MTKRTTRGLPRYSVAAGLLFLSGFLALGGVVVDRVQHGPTSYAPPGNLSRLVGDTIRLPATASLIDFGGDSIDLFFLDGMARNVVHVRHESSGWRLHGIHSRRGQGPGELRSPRSVSLWADSLLAISDLDEIDLFDRDGEYLRTMRPELPCRAPIVDLSASEHALFGSANCIHGDTMSAVLFRYDNVRPVIRLVAEPRMSLSGKWGSGLTALRSIGDDIGGVVFGTGRMPCVTRQKIGNSDPRRECWALTPYRSDPPKGFTAARGITWPDTLPYFVDRAGSASGRVFLIRPYSADSAVIVAAGPAGHTPVMVVPLSGMIGCRARGCAWTADAPGHTMIRLVPLSRLDSLAGAAR